MATNNQFYHYIAQHVINNTCAYVYGRKAVDTCGIVQAFVDLVFKDWED